MKLHTCALILAALAASAACNRPSEADCKKAIANIRELTGTDKLSTEKSNDARLLRSCKGAGKRTSVKCAINAKSIDELKACGLLKAAELEELDQLDRDLNRLRPAPAPAVVPPATVVPPVVPPATGDPAAPAPTDVAPTVPPGTPAAGTAPADGAAPAVPPAATAPVAPAPAGPPAPAAPPAPAPATP